MTTYKADKPWKISFYSKKVEKSTLSFPAGILANFLRTVNLIEENGPNIGMPYVAYMSNGLFEIRAKGEEGIGRVFFCMVIDKEIIL